MSVKNLAVTFLSLTLAACATSEADDRDQEEASHVDELEDVLLNGGALAVRVPALPKPSLPVCEEELCGDEAVQGGCCLSEHGTLCYSCELPVPPTDVEPSECQQDTECGDVMEGNRCAVDSGGRGTCYRICGGGLGFTCEEGEICMTPFVTFEQDGSGVCISPPGAEEEAQIDWSSTAAKAMEANKVDHLKDGILKHSQTQ